MQYLFFLNPIQQQAGSAVFSILYINFPCFKFCFNFWVILWFFVILLLLENENITKLHIHKLVLLKILREGFNFVFIQIIVLVNREKYISEENTPKRLFIVAKRFFMAGLLL